MTTWAITRAIPDSFAKALSMARPTEPIDVARARRQHEGYAAALRGLGVTVDVLPADDAFPDCCFVEDTAIVARGTGLVTYPGAPSRVGEREAMRAALAGRVRLESLEPTKGEPLATVDGGDVLVTRDHVFVGLSKRTNEAGARRVREVFEPLGLRVTTIPVEAGLHLKSVCSSLGPATVLLAEGTLPAAAFRPLEVVLVPAAETVAANVVSIGTRALVAAGFPRTLELLRARGVDAVPVDTSEMRKADGALTCLSILG